MLNYLFHFQASVHTSFVFVRLFFFVCLFLMEFCSPTYPTQLLSCLDSCRSFIDTPRLRQMPLFLWLSKHFCNYFHLSIYQTIAAGFFTHSNSLFEDRSSPLSHFFIFKKYENTCSASVLVLRQVKDRKSSKCAHNPTTGPENT